MDDQQIQEEGPQADAKRLEPEITARVKDVLHKIRRQLAASASQQALDKFIELVSPAHAYGRVGESRIPILWRGGNCVDPSWWRCLLWEVSRVVVTYWDCIREGLWKPYEAAVERLEEMERTGVHSYYTVPAEGTAGFILMTRDEWSQENRKREKRKQILAAQKERKWRQDHGMEPSS